MHFHKIASDELKKPYNTLDEMLSYQKEIRPDKVIYRFLENDSTSLTLTYDELYQRVQTLAAHLNTLINPGDRVILAARPGLDFVVGFYSCLVVGAIAVPIFPPANAMMTHRFIHVVKDSTPSLILCDQYTSKTLRKAQISNTFFPKKIKNFLGITDALTSLFTLLKQNKIPIISTEIEDAFNKNSKLILHTVSPDDIAFLQYTSGSTGNPRGVILTHKNLLDNLGIIQRVLNYNHNSHMFSWLPPYHDMGLIAGILEPLYAGSSASSILFFLNFLVSTQSILSSVKHCFAETITVASARP